MGIDGGLIHGRKVGVFHQHDFAIARVLFEVFLDRFLGFTDVDSEKNEPFGGEFLADLVDEGGFVRAVAAPSGPEFKQSYLALDRKSTRLNSSHTVISYAVFCLKKKKKKNKKSQENKQYTLPLDRYKRCER